ncbi:MAG: hypothetical protein EPN88_00710 [Bacteroidetes bacterium]|nr:MAG: hypothetical protein EPN88_00710 [Bacteroidota bacterium]
METICYGITKARRWHMIFEKEREITAPNSRFAKAGVSYFYDREVLKSRFVHFMKFSAENPRLRKAAKR